MLLTRCHFLDWTLFAPSVTLAGGRVVFEFVRGFQPSMGEGFCLKWNSWYFSNIGMGRYVMFTWLDNLFEQAHVLKDWKNHENVFDPKNAGHSTINDYQFSAYCSLQRMYVVEWHCLSRVCQRLRFCWYQFFSVKNFSTTICTRPRYWKSLDNKRLVFLLN